MKKEKERTTGTTATPPPLVGEPKKIDIFGFLKRKKASGGTAKDSPSLFGGLLKIAMVIIPVCFLMYGCTSKFTGLIGERMDREYQFRSSQVERIHLDTGIHTLTIGENWSPVYTRTGKYALYREVSGDIIARNENGVEVKNPHLSRGNFTSNRTQYRCGNCGSNSITLKIEVTNFRDE